MATGQIGSGRRPGRGEMYGELRGAWSWWLVSFDVSVGGEESMGMVMIFLRMRGPGADGALREPARIAAGAPQAAA